MPGDVCTQSSVGLTNSLVSTVLQTLIAAQCAISPPELWPKDFGPTAYHHGLGTYDFIVVGAGTAGSVMASRLSENPYQKVLVLEAGGNPPQEAMMPNTFYTLQHTDYTWNYLSEPDEKSCQGYKNQVCYCPRGKMIGGTGEINAMLHIEGIPTDYENWKKKGNPYWGWNDVLPFFEKSTKFGGNKSECIGGVNLNPFNVHYSEVREMIFDAAAELGVPRLESFNEDALIGFTALPGTVENGRRQSTGLSYLAKAKKRPNLHVIKNVVVRKINFDKTGKRATGVTFTYKNNRKMTVNAAKEVIISAGAIDSAKLLMLSGIGPKKHLKKLNIPLIKNLRVGDNFQDHILIPLFFKFNDSKVRRETPKDVLDASYAYLTSQSGPLSTHGTATVTGLINSDKSSVNPDPDISYHHIFMASGSSALEVWSNSTVLSDRIAQGLRDINTKDHIMMLYVIILRPKSIGKVRLRSADPTDPPMLFTNFLDHEEDIETLLRGFKFQMEIEKTDTYQEQGGKIIQLDLPECDRFPFKGRKYWKCYMKYMSTTGFHVSGSVKMGPDTDYSAVLDWRLRVKGIRGLRVADASIMPDIVSVNPNAAIIMIAERAAEFVKEDWGVQYEANC